MPKTPLAVRYDVALIAEIDRQAGRITPPPSRGWMINHLLWRAVNATRNVDRAAERLHRISGTRGDEAWDALPDNRKQIYRDLIGQLIEDLSHA